MGLSKQLYFICEIENSQTVCKPILRYYKYSQYEKVSETRASKQKISKSLLETLGKSRLSSNYR